MWFKNQEKEQQLLEYECSVKYEEKLEAKAATEASASLSDTTAISTSHAEGRNYQPCMKHQLILDIYLRFACLVEAK